MTPFAIDVVALDNDFAKIDADAVADALGFGDLSPGLFCRLLYRQRAIHGGDDAGELHQCAVAHQLEHAAAMGGDLGIENRAAVGLQPFKRPRLVGLHEAAVADHIGGQDGREFALHDSKRARILP